VQHQNNLGTDLDSVWGY